MPGLYWFQWVGGTAVSEKLRRIRNRRSRPGRCFRGKNRLQGGHGVENLVFLGCVIQLASLSAVESRNKAATRLCSKQIAAKRKHETTQHDHQQAPYDDHTEPGWYAPFAKGWLGQC